MTISRTCVLGSIALLAVGIVSSVGWLRARSEAQRERAVFGEHRTSLCAWRMSDLQSVLGDPGTREIHTRVRDHLEAAVLELCLGPDGRVDRTAADNCWVWKADDERKAYGCYADLVRDLLARYRAHEPDWR